MFLNRVIGVFRLDARTFEEVEHDRGATGQAALIVAIVALVNSLSAGFLAETGAGSFLPAFISGLIWAFIGWLVWSALTYFIGVVLFRGRADLGEMLRVIGFASAPLVLGIIPCIGGIVGVLWMAAAVFIAVRQGLDLDGGRAFLTMVIGLIFYIFGYLWLVVISGIFGMITG
jgi:hypothetical protein